ncbi:hypothetical protein DICVIV_10140 [Dictyocaulus viviparus]|uniref:Uncharacterized protein n=1 Tax=Dictyocaulus viviparus TaxID=29172 RepID=A0A0D8XJ68_DICVI|nr:hypothetical protein DICVIV_10140 [Dictyocaulus viviparus]
MKSMSDVKSLAAYSSITHITSIQSRRICLNNGPQCRGSGLVRFYSIQSIVMNNRYQDSGSFTATLEEDKRGPQILILDYPRRSQPKMLTAAEQADRPTGSSGLITTGDGKVVIQFRFESRHNIFVQRLRWISGSAMSTIAISTP